jgi:hypothetical protein
VNAPHIFKPNVADISDHLHALFPPAFVHHFPDAQIEMIYGPPGVFTVSRWFSAFDLKAIAGFAEVRNALGENINVGAALRHGSEPEGGRANGQNYLAAQCAWCEYDGAGDHERIVAICKEKQLEPAIIVTTGTVPDLRQHLYFWIKGGITDPVKLKEINARLRDLFGSDDVTDAIRIMRLAGCVNYPTEKKQRDRGYAAELVAVKVAQQPREYSIEELGASQQQQQRDRYDFNGGSSFGFKYTKTDDDIETLLQASRKPGQWHNAMRNAIAVMIGRGWSDDAIRFSCAPYCDDGKDDPDLVPLINGARQKWDKPNPGDTDKAGAGAQAPQSPRFLFETVSDLRSMPPAEYLVNAWIPERSVGLLFGRWGSGKTFLGFDLALHLAFGLLDWHGAKLPGEPCDVLIIAREGHAGFVKRVSAFMKRHGLTEDTKHLVFMRSSISFLDDNAFEQLKQAIKALNRPFRFVLVDTVGRVLPGADMAKEQPITLFMERLQQLGELTGGTAMGVHHENKSGDANGSMYFQNNSDFMFQISRDGEGPLECGKLKCVKQKEGDDLWSREVTFAKVELPDGKSSLVVEDVLEETREPNSEAVKKRRALKSEHKLALDALDAALIDHGKRIYVADAPIGTVVVHKDDWMSELFRRGLLDKTAKNRWRDFGRVWKALAARSLIATRDDMFWRASHG